MKDSFIKFCWIIAWIVFAKTMHYLTSADINTIYLLIILGYTVMTAHES